MRKIIGSFFVILGAACLLTSAGLVIYNRSEAKNAEIISRTMLQTMQERMEQPIPATEAPEHTGESVSEMIHRGMKTIELDGYDCIGVLSIPVLELELPVLADWSYAKLKKAPCQYYGTCYDTDFVIAAHNYPSHFGRLSELQKDDLILFTDAESTVYCYKVVLMETLPPTATEEMITSGFDLSLYTCTSGGGNRVTVRCEKVS